MSAGPQPTGHEVVPSCSLTRRRMLQASGAAVGASAVGSTSLALAQDGSFDGTCDSTLRFAFPISCGFADPDEDIDESQTASAIEVDLHVSSQSVYEQLIQQNSIYQNYLEDTSVLASLDAREAIASAWEDGKSETQATSDAKSAINAYYSHHQQMLLEMLSAHCSEVAYLQTVQQSHEDIPDDFIHPWVPYDPDGTVEHESWSFDGTETKTYVLADSTEVTYQMLAFSGSACPSASCYSYLPLNIFEDFESGTNGQDNHYTLELDGSANRMLWAGCLQVQNQPDAGLDSTTVYDFRLVSERMEQLEAQAQEVVNAYPEGTAADLYAAMDNGSLDPNDVRGAEGMVRHLSGDATSTSEALQLALKHTLDLEGPVDLQSRVEVELDAVTEIDRNESQDGGAVTYQIANQTAQTLEGVIFGRSPNDVIEKGETYATFDDRVSFLDDSQYESGGSKESMVQWPGTPTLVVGEGEEITLFEGEFTVTNLWDADGNEVSSIDLSGPEYESYNADDFIASLDQTSERREEIVEEDGSDSDGDGGIGLPNFGFGDGGGGFVGFAIIGIAVLAVVGFVTDLIPGMGE